MAGEIEVTGVKRFTANALGRDIVVGDIHGHFSRLQAALDAAIFDPAVDRLFSVGDLVDRGPECEHVIEWLNKPWFHAVQGNHEAMALDHVRNPRADVTIYAQNGGTWFLALNRSRQQSYATMFARLPIAIEADTANGIVGIVHADCPYPSWTEFATALSSGHPALTGHLRAVAQWSRRRISEDDQSQVNDAHAVVVGHTPLRRPLVLGNVHHIDTGGWLKDGSGYFTLLDLGTLSPISHLPDLL